MFFILAYYLHYLKNSWNYAIILADYTVLCFRVILICIEFGQKIIREMQKKFFVKIFS